MIQLLTELSALIVINLLRCHVLHSLISTTLFSDIMSDLDRCKKYLRGVLLAHKGGVLRSQIVAKYREITGESVPYRRFNFNSLDAFLQSIPDVCSVSVQNGDLMLYVKGVGIPETKHIEDLIQAQGRRRRGSWRLPVMAPWHYQYQPHVNHHQVPAVQGLADDSGVESDYDY